MEDISVITAVHHPLRRRIVDVLLLHGATRVTALARRLDAQVGSISHHLRMLERAGVVERVADPDGDRRTSWWRLAREGFSWSADDFADSPADALLAREAERHNVRAQLDRLRGWLRTRDDPAYAEYDAFSIDALAWATPEELSDLSRRIQEVLSDWRGGIDAGDGAPRVPVAFFAHGFPTEA
ncbi:ArsR/SmtB family transcription factor [Microbacterium sp. gxy059]|uniref:ArsR/SmtB family transcription factor n=1 Tax=Microbacterium sp. gxy059 TaxID=2957199 RepID=UPI003D99AF27